MRALVVCGALAAAACGGDDIPGDARPRVRGSGELALPPSAGAPRVMRDAAPPDTFQPDSSDEFAITPFDSLPFPGAIPGALPGAVDVEVELLARSYRGHYTDVVAAEGTAVRGRIDRQLQQEAERRTAQERGFPDWTGLIEALSPEQRARLVDRLNEANIELARELHGSSDEPEPNGTAPPGR
jgi:hypothetical protein